MIIDKQFQLSDSQAITATAASTNIYDTGTTADVGPGNPQKIVSQIMADFNTLTSLDIALQTDDNASFTSATTLGTRNLVLASLTAGTTIESFIPKDCERYIRMNYTVNGANPSTGSISSFMVLDSQANTSLPDGL